MRFASGTTDQYVHFMALDSTDFTTPETGLTGFTVYRSRNGAAAAAMTTPTVAEVDATNMAGVYTLLLDEDMTLSAGNETEAMAFYLTQASMAPVVLEIELYRPVGSGGDILAANVVQIDGNATSAARLALSSAAIETGTATGTPTTTEIADTARSETQTDLFVGRVIIITSGALAGEATPITAYNGTTKAFTVTAMTAAISTGDSYIVI